MVRGERDYTQRSIATMKIGSIIGSNIIFIEDFESKVQHILPSMAFSVSTADGYVWRGEASGKLTSVNGASRYVAIGLPLITFGRLEYECIIRLDGTDIQSAHIYFFLYHGGAVDTALLRVYRVGSTYYLQVMDEDGNYVSLQDIGAVGNDSSWHLLYMRINATTREYENLRFDHYSIPGGGRKYRTQAGVLACRLEAYVGAQSTATTTAYLYFDDLLISWSDL